MPTYNCKHSGDQYRITKFNRDGDTESSYLCSHHECECPAGVRPTCRHRQMLPLFLELNLVDTQWFIDWDNHRTVVDFNGVPKPYYDDFEPSTNETLPHNETCEPAPMFECPECSSDLAIETHQPTCTGSWRRW